MSGAAPLGVTAFTCRDAVPVSALRPGPLLVQSRMKTASGPREAGAALPQPLAPRLRGWRPSREAFTRKKKIPKRKEKKKNNN